MTVEKEEQLQSPYCQICSGRGVTHSDVSELERPGNRPTCVVSKRS